MRHPSVTHFTEAFPLWRHVLTLALGGEGDAHPAAGRSEAKRRQASGESMCEIVVPLDGSTCAEQALPWARAIATRSGGAVNLVQVDVPFRVPSCQEVLGERATRELRRLADERRDQHRTYLEEMEERLRLDAPGSVVTTAVLRGPLWPALVEYAGERDATLFVVATRARPPLNRAWLGSLTNDLVRRCSIPVLLVRATDAPPPEPRFGRLLVALDGSVERERAIPHAVALARVFDAGLLLVRVTHPREDGVEASRYLEGVVARLRPSGVAAESVLIESADVAEALTRAATEREADLVVLASRYRAGLSQVMFGNVAESLIRLGTQPVLVVGDRVRVPHDAGASRVVAWG